MELFLLLKKYEIINYQTGLKDIFQSGILQLRRRQPNYLLLIWEPIWEKLPTN